ncbi:MAG: CbiX/SirB N-terminal domain-containing protein [Cyanobacteria bacterium J06638_28]
MLSAYLLVSHGSSDPRHQAGLLRLANITRQHLTRLQYSQQHTETMGQFYDTYRSHQPDNAVEVATVGTARNRFPSRAHKSLERSILPPNIAVGTATLEASQVPLARQIEVFTKRVMAHGIRRVVLVPLFLQEGVHVKEDLPREIAIARALLPTTLRLVCEPYLGGQPIFKQFVADRLQKTTADRCLLLAHGSRRPGGNRNLQQLADSLSADVAFWSVPPDLETQVVNLMQQGYRQIAIAPYFLLPGGITDAITRQTEALAERLSKLSLRLLAPLGTSSDLGIAIAETLFAATPTFPLPKWGRDRWQPAQDGITA